MSGTSRDTSSTASAFAGLSPTTIENIRQAALASAPSVAAPFINARFDAASASSSSASPSSTFSTSVVAPSVIGTTLAQPTISFIREQILANAPSAYASAIAEQFTVAASGATQAAAPEAPAAAQPTEPAQSAAPAQPAEPVQPAAPTPPAPVLSAAPAQPAEPAQPAAPVQPAASNTANAEASAIGQTLAAPAIEFVRQQIMSVLPAEYSASILARFPNPPAAFNDSGSSTQPTTAASLQASVVVEEIRAYFAAQNNPLP